MMTRPSLRLVFLLLAVLIFLAAATAVAAANTVPGTALGNSSRAVTLNDLKPSQCSGIFIARLIVGSGTITGTDGNDLDSWQLGERHDRRAARDGLHHRRRRCRYAGRLAG